MTATLLDRPAPATLATPATAASSPSSAATGHAGTTTAAPATLALTVHVRREAAPGARAGRLATPRYAPRPAVPVPAPLPAWLPAPTPVRPAEAHGARVRLTRRGRALRSLLVLAVGLLVVTAVLVRGGAPAAGSDGPVPVQPQTVVQPGETLWSIAQRVAPGADPRATVLRLKELNGLTTSRVDAGQPLLLPTER